MKSEWKGKTPSPSMRNTMDFFAHTNRFIRRKGSLSPIQVTMKVRQGRKASTLITGFEPFLVIDAEEMAEDLRKVCAGATSGNVVILAHKSTLQLESFLHWFSFANARETCQF